MFQWLKKTEKKISQGAPEERGSQSQTVEDLAPNNVVLVSDKIADNFKFLKDSLGNNTGIFYRNFKIGKEKQHPALLIAVSNMADDAMINLSILRPLMKMEAPLEEENFLVYLKESVLTVAEVEIEDNLVFLSKQIFSGKVVLFLEGEKKALMITARGWEIRQVEQPVTETVVRGPRDAFVEDLSVNLSLLRRRIRDPRLRCEELIMGEQTNTRIVIIYMEGITNEDIVAEVRRRVGNIRIDGVLESGYIEQYIEDTSATLFPTIGNSEKPDIVAAQLLEGRVAVMVDGTPIVLTMPYLLINNFQVSEDYYSRPFYANFMRILRIVSFLISLLFPGIFVAVQYYHPILIPFSLLVRQAILRAEVPFQLYVEIILMLLIFEIIREAGLRMPKPIGQAVSIVGALILGQAAVDAGLVGIPVVVTVALVGIAIFPINPLTGAVTILRIVFIVVGATLGLFGILILSMVVVSHLASMRSFGVPYTAPLFPIYIKDWKDTIIRFPLWMLGRRPQVLQTSNVIREKWGGISGHGMRGKK